jgi:hypothetical protein
MPQSVTEKTGSGTLVEISSGNRDSIRDVMGATCLDNFGPAFARLSRKFTDHLHPVVSLYGRELAFVGDPVLQVRRCSRQGHDCTTASDGHDCTTASDGFVEGQLNI